MKHCFTLLLCLLLLRVSAEHILGGYITYRFISGTTYEVKLTLYRNCNSASPFDGTGGVVSAAYLGVFQGTTLVNTFGLVNPVITPIALPYDTACPLNYGLCIEKGVYTENITLPSANIKYNLVHLRCCFGSNPQTLPMAIIPVWPL